MICGIIFLPTFSHVRTHVAHTSNEWLTDDYGAFCFYFTVFSRCTVLHPHMHFLHLSFCLLSWSFPTLSHLYKPWNIKQAQTSGLVMLTSVACVRILPLLMCWWFIAAWIESITLTENTLGTHAVNMLGQHLISIEQEHKSQLSKTCLQIWPSVFLCCTHFSHT